MERRTGSPEKTSTSGSPPGGHWQVWRENFQKEIYPTSSDVRVIAESEGEPRAQLFLSHSFLLCCKFSIHLCFLVLGTVGGYRLQSGEGLAPAFSRHMLFPGSLSPLCSQPC